MGTFKRYGILEGGVPLGVIFEAFQVHVSLSPACVFDMGALRFFFFFFVPIPSLCPHEISLKT